jgi:hypothetical protein
VDPCSLSLYAFLKSANFAVLQGASLTQREERTEREVPRVPRRVRYGTNIGKPRDQIVHQFARALATHQLHVHPFSM